MGGVEMLIHVVGAVCKTLRSEEVKEVFSSFNFQSQLKKLQDSFNIINETLLALDLEFDLDDENLTREVKIWVDGMKDGVYEAEDLMDDLITNPPQKEKQHQLVGLGGGKMMMFKKVPFLSCSCSSRPPYPDIFDEIQHIVEHLEAIASDYLKISLGIHGKYQPVRNEETYAYVYEADIVGREEDKNAIIHLLLSPHLDHHVLPFVPIVGNPGVGKTALAQLVFNDNTIQREFIHKFWVSVSFSTRAEFDITEILRTILGYFEDTDHTSSSIHLLYDQLQELLSGESYLLVLDDVSIVIREEWLKLKRSLPYSRGSQVLVTAGSKLVASIIGDMSSVYELQGLSEENSWQLFKKVAFMDRGKQETIDTTLEQIGRKILKNCGGIPLHIRGVGRLLYGQREDHWLHFERRGLDIRSMTTLKRCYNRLSTPLKICFTCCALFPKDYVFRKEKLISLWLALGIISPYQETFETINEVAEKHFSHLLQGYYIQAAEVDASDAILSYKLSLPMHYLAQGVARNLFLSMKSPSDKVPRHITVTDECMSLFSTTDYLAEMNKLHALVLITDKLLIKTFCESSLHKIISSCRRLRILDFQSSCLETLPSTISELLHLRCLDLSNNKLLKKLPESISSLCKLEALMLHGCRSLLELPVDLYRLINLNHLDILGCDRLTHMPSGMEKLIHLHTLTMFVVGVTESLQGEFGQLKDLKALVELRGELTIKVDRISVGNERIDYQGSGVLRKAHLKTIHIKMKSDSYNQFDGEGRLHEVLLEGLDPESHLREVDMMGYQGLRLPRWFSLELPYLVRISLRCLSRLQHLESLSQLRHLKFLQLKSLLNLVYLEGTTADALVETGDSKLILFPSLEELRLESLPMLKGWWIDVQLYVEVGLFPHLRQLHIKSCPNLSFPPMSSSVACNSSYPILEELRIQCFDEENLTTFDEVFRWCASPLKNLLIYDCENLKGLSGGGLEHLKNLQHLSICSAQNLTLDEDDSDGMPWKSLQNLSSLTLAHLPKLVTLPSGFQHLTALQSFQIDYCGSLTSLPEWLSSLKHLKLIKISSCCQLRPLPETIMHIVDLKLD